MLCARCGYELQPFDSACPRCARWASTPCSLCGTVPVAAVCSQCDAEICDECTLSTPSGIFCSRCATREHLMIPAPGPPPEPSPLVSPLAAPTAAGPPAPAGPAYAGEVWVPGVSRGTGFFDSASRALAFIRESMAMAFRDKDLLLPSLFSLLGSAAVLGALLGIAQATGLLKWLLQSRRSDWQELLVLAPVAFAIYAVSYFFTGMTINLVDTHLKGRDARLGEAFADSWKNLGALLWLALATTGVNLATAAIRSVRRGRGPEDYAADAIDRVWLVASFLILPAIIIEDRPARDAIERARQLHSANLLPIAVGEIGVSLVARILGMVTLVAAVGLGYLLWTATHGLMWPIAVGGLLLAFVSTFNAFVRTAYYTCLFLWAVEVERVGAAAPAPAPLARALAPA